MTKKAKYYLVEHMCGPDIIKTTDKRKIKAWLKNFYQDSPYPVAKCEVEDATIVEVSLTEVK